MSKSLPRSTPEEQGVDSQAILRFVEDVDARIHEMHSFMLMRHGKVIAEGWWKPYAAGYPHMLFSLSKSFTSTAVGMAASEGLLDIDDRVLSFFPDDAPAEPDDNLKALRIRQLLSMSTGHNDDTTDGLMADPQGRWVRAFLHKKLDHRPGIHFMYNTGATYVLSAIVQKVSGMRLLDYLTPRFFEPLGIEDATWEQSPEGIDTGGFGLNVKTEDIAKLGQLYLQKGQWEGRHLLPRTWVEMATAKQVSNGCEPASDWNQGYAFQFWRCRHNAYRGDGAFGQYCVVMPDLDAVLAITGGMGDMQPPLNIVWDMLLPAFHFVPLPANPSAHQALTERLASLAHPPLAHCTAPALAETVSGKKYSFIPDSIQLAAMTFDPNSVRLNAMAFDFGPSGASLHVWSPLGEQTIPLGYGAWVESPTTIDPRLPARIAACGAWTSEDTFTIIQRQLETPFYFTQVNRFDGDHLHVATKANVSFGPLEMPELVGKAV